MWKGLVSENRKNIFSQKLNEITNVLENNFSKINETGLLSGKLGIALYFFYYSSYSGKEKYANLGLDIISDVFKDIRFVNFSDGYAGLGWTIEHLVNEGFIDSDAKSFLMNFDGPLEKHMIEDIKDENYDYLTGAFGYVLYFLKRLSCDEIEVNLSQFLQNLNATGINTQEKYKWTSIVNAKQKLMGVDLGLAHGQISIVALLIKIVGIGIASDGVSEMLNGAIKYIIDQHEFLETRLSVFPNFIIEGIEKDNSRLAWCYGDLGIGITLWRASQVLKDKKLESFSIKVLIHTTKRKDLQSNFVRDAILCHGAAGVAHIYNRMYNYTLINEFKEASQYWFDETLKMARFKDGYAGYKSYYGENIWKNQLGLLEGIAGVGLSLISAISHIEPSWDECLLLS